MFRHATKFAPRSTEPFAVALEAGYDSVEFWLNAELIDQWQDIVLLARSFPFTYQLHFPNGGELNDRQIHNLVCLYQELACSALVIHQPMFDEYAEAIMALDENVHLAVENHYLDSNRKLQKWAELSPYLTLDVEHLWLFTKTESSLKSLLQATRALFDDWGEKIIHVHLPGYLPGFKEHRPQYCSRNMVMKVFSLLADYRYAGFVVSETANRYQNVEELTMDRLLFQHWKNERNAKQETKLLATAE